ncbi:Hypothetical protein ERS024288_04060 [Mycobacterium tuberculosis]|nr:Hypothetical protein ERS024288_04060 [Mycobacterium tuberculosis]CKS56499.1 Hypothetical protein ERS027665_04005 [Mycobacterium tuberculosis]
MKHKTDIDEWLDTIEPNPADAHDASHLRRIIAAKEAVQTAESELRAAVNAARAAGDTWAAIGSPSASPARPRSNGSGHTAQRAPKPARLRGGVDDDQTGPKRSHSVWPTHVASCLLGMGFVFAVPHNPRPVQIPRPLHTATRRPAVS